MLQNERALAHLGTLISERSTKDWYTTVSASVCLSVYTQREREREGERERERPLFV